MAAEELGLAEALAAAEGVVNEALAAIRYRDALAEYASLRGPIDEFFDKVLVMDPSAELRTNRLRLLNRFVELFERFADFGRLEG
jgi:glycyl-tRNA synthetase beta chain